MTEQVVDAEIIDRCLKHVAAAIKQGQMRGFDEQTLMCALIASGLMMFFRGEVDKNQAYGLARFCCLLSDEIIFERRVYDLQKAVNESGGIGLAELEEVKRQRIQQRAAQPPHLIPPQSITAWARLLATSYDRE